MHVRLEQCQEEGNDKKGPGTCQRCGYISSNPLCKACVLLEGLNKGKAKLAVGRQSKSLVSSALTNNASDSTPIPSSTTTPSTLPSFVDPDSIPHVDRITLLHTSNFDF
jgi:hypothetical protein